MEYFSYGQIILGPAGSGKSTYCKIIQDHSLTMKRNIKVVNLDPAAEKFLYKCDIDIRSLINVSDIMKKKKLGPNGALIYCMEYLSNHIEWLEDQLNSNGDNVYYLFDCPGQLELYSHSDVLKKITSRLKKGGYNLCSIFCLDCTFLQEQSKFISGTMLSLATMIQMELPHLTVMTKCDLIKDSPLIEKIKEGIEPNELESELTPYIGKKISRLNTELSDFVKNYALVEFHTMNINDEESVNEILYNADLILQYYDNQEPRDDLYERAEKNLMDIQEENDE